jgi:acetoin utilization deacetylase AcuC-like enzyme
MTPTLQESDALRAFYCDEFVLPLPPGHTFPMAKYALLRERVRAEGLVPEADLVVPPAASTAELLRVHTAEYVRDVIEGTLPAEVERAIGLPWSPGLVERSRRSVGGTIAAARAALTDGVAVNLAGGTHHAFADRGSGYCVFNDVAVAVRALQEEGRVRHAVILDLDVHQGDGTAAIFAGDPSVFTLSVHGARNFPLRKQRSDLDIELDDGTGDAAYLAAVERGVAEAIERSGAEIAFYLAGADPYEGDRLGRMKVTRGGLAARDALVFDACRESGLPVAVSLAGGYAKDIRDTVAIQAETVRAAVQSSRLF